LSSTTQSMDYKNKGVRDICGLESELQGSDPTLTKTLSRKIFNIINDAKNLQEIIPDLAYLAARNEGLSPDTALGKIIYNVIDMIRKGTNKDNIMKYMEGVVMAVYIIEEAKKDKNNIDAYRILGCG